jgi:SulP family sulfate permease
MAEADTETADASGQDPEVNQPGLSEVRDAVANHLERRLPSRASIRDDALAGLNSAVSSVPDAMASGILVGVNPIYGLYACMVGPIAGGTFSSTALMIIATTSAASLSAGQALGALQGDARDTALFLMVVLIGVLQMLFGLLRMGKLTRFVSYSVMTGFILGIAVLTILSQLPTISGYEPTAGSNKVTQAYNLLSNLDRVNLWSLAVAIVTAVLAILLPRTRLGNFGRLVAIIVPSLLVLLFQLGSVQIVRDVGEIPKGIPMPHLPSFAGFSFDVLTGAFAVAVIILVQGAGVSQSVPNPDGSPRSTSRDFFAQGAANLASGFFRGLPVGGSLSTTALTVISGSRSRWAAIFAGLWMALLVIVFPKLVSYVVMPALGVLLIIASLSTIKPREALAIWYTGWPSRLAGVTTFLCTLLLPIQAAVGIGVVLSALLYISESSTDVSVVQLLKQPDGVIKEREAPGRLESNKVTVLDVYGHLFYAGARTLESLLPEPRGAENAVVVLRLRGRSKLGATLVEVLANYADRLHDANGRLYLSGLSANAYGEVVRTGKLRLSGPVRVYEATSSRGQSTNQAFADAQSWLVSKSEEISPNENATSDFS